MCYLWIGVVVGSFQDVHMRRRFDDYVAAAAVGGGG